MQKLKIVLLIALLLLGLAVNGAKAQEVPGLKVRVEGKGSPMVMIPGLTCSGEVWDSTIASMGTGYEYHIITLPGFAGSAPIEDHEGKFLEKMKDLVLEYIREQGLEKPVIVGHSLGGFLALQIAIDSPDLPSKLVIVDSLPFLPAIQMPGATAATAKPMAESMKNMMLNSSQSEEARIAQQRMMLKTMIADDDNIEIALKWGLQSDTETVAQAMYELYTIDIREELSKIKVPTLVMGAYIAYKPFGVTRESTLKNYTDQYARLDGVIVDLTDKGNHFIMWDDPEYLQSWLKKFL